MKITLEECKRIMDQSGGWLDLRGTGITSLPDNLTVGCSLDLSGTGITALPDNLTVGGSLDLRGTGITALPDNLTVGGSLDLRGTGITVTERKKARVLKNGDYVPGRYIFADDMLTHIKGEKRVGNFTFCIGKIKGKNIVTDGEYYAHCKTLRDGIADIAFKKAADRGADQYRDINLDTVLSVQEMITMYRVITGACRAGAEGFVASLKDIKDRYTVAEAIALTKGQYGADHFAAFFDKE